MIFCTDGSSPLHKTAYSGTLEMLALLLNLGANGLLRVIYITWRYLNRSYSHYMSLGQGWENSTSLVHQ